MHSTTTGRAALVVFGADRLVLGGCAPRGAGCGGLLPRSLELKGKGGHTSAKTILYPSAPAIDRFARPTKSHGCGVNYDSASTITLSPCVNVICWDLSGFRCTP